ncbi:RNA polymerase sigma factor RpoD/SigA [Fibrobacterota bacterium]
MYKHPTLATKLYLKDILQTSPLSKQEEQELFRMFLKGSSRARTKLLYSNMRFVLKVAQQYRLAPVPLSDLIAEGAMGLMRAIESFDPSRGLRFISYAVWWIKVYITRLINEQGSLIRLPAHQTLKVRRAIKASAGGKKIDDETLMLIKLLERGIPFDAPVNENVRTPFAEVIPDNKAFQPDNIALLRSLEASIRQVLSELPEREATILKGLYGIDFGKPVTLEEVSENLSLSKERVRQLRDRALRKLKSGRHRKKLRESFEGCLIVSS